jgi:hypothetical protein
VAGSKNKICLRKQREAVLGLHGEAKRAGINPQTEALNAVCETLMWLEKYEKQVKLGIQIADKALKDPIVMKLVGEFPGLALVDVRRRQESVNT